jgi:hypothetical protein
MKRKETATLPGAALPRESTLVKTQANDNDLVSRTALAQVGFSLDDSRPRITAWNRQPDPQHFSGGFPFRQANSVKTYSTHNMPGHAIPRGRILMIGSFGG